jgi:prepilin-type N-terminal cleavage/methylation domain-containing protein
MAMLTNLRHPMSKLSPRHRGQDGFTLVEVLVTIAILLVVAVAIQRFLFAGFTTYAFGQDTFTAQEKVELAQRYLDRALREIRSVEAADPKGTYIVVRTDADNDGSYELVEYWVDYSDGKLKSYVDETPFSGDTYNFSDPNSSPSLVRTDIITSIQGTAPVTNQESLLSPNPSDSGRPFIFFGDDPNLSLDYLSTYTPSAAAWVNQIKGVRTYFYVDVSPTTGGPTAYSLQMYIRFRNVR